MQLLASTLALVALVLRLMLPLLHDGHAHAPRADDSAARDACACAVPVTAPWWQAAGDADAADGERERERGGDHFAAAAVHGHCLACAEAQLPPAPPAPFFDVPQLAAAPTPTVAAPRAPPLKSPERSQHHSRAPPHAHA